MLLNVILLKDNISQFDWLYPEVFLFFSPIDFLILFMLCCIGYLKGQKGPYILLQYLKSRNPPRSPNIQNYVYHIFQL